MNRRLFVRLAGGTVAGMTLLPPSLRGGTAPLLQSLRVNGQRLGQRMSELATFGANAAGGIDRVAFSDADLAARDWLAGHMRDAGLEVSVDVAGNLIGRKPGTEPGLRPLAFGSHIDSVPGGGNYDGQVGSMGALEVARTLHDAGHRTRHPLEMLVFPNEEGGKTGSRALAGEVEAFEIDIVTASGFTIGDGIRRIGGDPDRLTEVWDG